VCIRPICEVTGRFAPLSVRPLDDSPHRRFAPGHFAPWTFRPLDVSSLGRFAPWTFRTVDVLPPRNGRFAPLTVRNNKAQLKSDFNQCSQLFKHTQLILLTAYMFFMHTISSEMSINAEAL